MRIISFINADAAPSFHRCYAPLMLMPNTDVLVTNDFNPEHFEKGCDILMYNRIITENVITEVQQLKEKYGFKICVDVDDYWELDPHHTLYDHYQETEFAKKQIWHITNADVVTVTHDRLAELVKPYNKNVHVLPNAIAKVGQFDIEREPYYLTRLFWQGSDTHREDLQLLATPIEKLGNIAAKIKMIISGWADSEYWDDMIDSYTAKLKHQYKIIPYAPINEYYKAYAHADICLIPLLNSSFNRMKSNLKVLEAANLGLPVICSDVHPYKDLPVLYCKHSGDWIKHINRLVASRKRQKEAGAKLKEYVDIHFNFEKINKERKQIFEHVSKSALCN